MCVSWLRKSQLFFSEDEETVQQETEPGSGGGGRHQSVGGGSTGQHQRRHCVGWPLQGRIPNKVYIYINYMSFQSTVLCFPNIKFPLFPFLH